MDRTQLVRVFDANTATRISTFQVRRVEAGSMTKLRSLISYLAENRSLRLVHEVADETMGNLTVYLTGDELSLELVKARVETVFPELDVSVAPGLGQTLRKAA